MSCVSGSGSKSRKQRKPPLSDYKVWVKIGRFGYYPAHLRMDGDVPMVEKDSDGNEFVFVLFDSRPDFARVNVNQISPLAEASGRPQRRNRRTPKEAQEELEERVYQDVGKSVGKLPKVKKENLVEDKRPRRQIKSEPAQVTASEKLIHHLKSNDEKIHRLNPNDEKQNISDVKKTSSAFKSVDAETAAPESYGNQNHQPYNVKVNIDDPKQSSRKCRAVSNQAAASEDSTTDDDDETLDQDDESATSDSEDETLADPDEEFVPESDETEDDDDYSPHSAQFVLNNKGEDSRLKRRSSRNHDDMSLAYVEQASIECSTQNGTFSPEASIASDTCYQPQFPSLTDAMHPTSQNISCSVYYGPQRKDWVSNLLAFGAKATVGGRKKFPPERLSSNKKKKSTPRKLRHLPAADDEEYEEEKKLEEEQQRSRKKEARREIFPRHPRKRKQKAKKRKRNDKHQSRTKKRKQSPIKTVVSNNFQRDEPAAVGQHHGFNVVGISGHACDDVSSVRAAANERSSIIHTSSRRRKLVARKSVLLDLSQQAGCVNAGSAKHSSNDLAREDNSCQPPQQRNKEYEFPFSTYNSPPVQEDMNSPYRYQSGGRRMQTPQQLTQEQQQRKHQQSVPGKSEFLPDSPSSVSAQKDRKHCSENKTPNRNGLIENGPSRKDSANTKWMTRLFFLDSSDDDEDGKTCNATSKPTETDTDTAIFMDSDDDEDGKIATQHYSGGRLIQTPQQLTQ